VGNGLTMQPSLTAPIPIPFIDSEQREERIGFITMCVLFSQLYPKVLLQFLHSTRFLVADRIYMIDKYFIRNIFQNVEKFVLAYEKNLRKHSKNGNIYRTLIFIEIDFCYFNKLTRNTIIFINI